jgi:hypothetical protein
MSPAFKLIRADQHGAAVRLSRDQVQDFAASWPCFGEVRHALEFAFDSRGDLVDVSGDAGLDERGVLALVTDTQSAIFMAGYCPQWAFRFDGVSQ